jgi:hypothetical protein
MPRPKLTPTREQRIQVKSMAAVGTPHEDIAMKIGIRSPKTLRKHYRKELDLAAIDANASVGGALYKRAMAGNTDAQKFWLERRAGWRVWQPPSGTFAPPPFIVAREKKKE